MPVVNFNTVQKPLDQRLVDAACIYFDVEADFFRIKRKDGSNDGRKSFNWTDKRRCLYWLMKEDAGMSYDDIAKLFGFHKDSMRDGIDQFDFQKSIYPSLTNDINNIRKIAGNLEASIEIGVMMCLKNMRDGIHSGATE